MHVGVNMLYPFGRHWFSYKRYIKGINNRFVRDVRILKNS